MTAGMHAAALDTLPVPDMSPSVAVDADGFRLSQHFTEPSVIIGGNVTVDYELENRGAGARSDIALEIYFLLENTSLVSAPSQCRRQPSLSGQEILYCELGDFSAGSRRSFSVTVATSENSRPAVVASALIGDLRVDSSAPVVHDTLSDNDGDGVSDFIETLRRTDPADASSVDDSIAAIDLMALYTPAAARLYPASIENRINGFINAANSALYNSEARIRLRPVHFQFVPYVESGDANRTLTELMSGSHPAFAGVMELRQRYGADLVVLFDAAESETKCGLAPIGGFGMQGDFSDPAEMALGYAWVAADCAQDLVRAQELGHNMGLTHSHREDGYGGTFDFATGYGVDEEFATVMATPSRFSVPNRTSIFSNPDLQCGEFACGRPQNEDMGANATATLNIVAPQVESWLPRTMPDLPFLHGRSLIAGSTSARLALAGQINDELGYADSAGSGDVLRLVAEIEVDPQHIGLTGSFHVLITADSREFHQLDREIGLTLWDGTLGGLRSATFERALRPIERFHIVDNYEVAANLRGIEIQIYLAYQIPGEIIYLHQPLRLRFTN
ncbi:MAG: hypothetical protein F4Z20_04855 [Gammaproteobacteria bacterium]|nr:hypothetical protein [Gammaproteobacteria bacterium]